MFLVPSCVCKSFSSFLLLLLSCHSFVYVVVMDQKEISLFFYQGTQQTASISGPCVNCNTQSSQLHSTQKGNMCSACYQFLRWGFYRISVVVQGQVSRSLWSWCNQIWTQWHTIADWMVKTTHAASSVTCHVTTTVWVI